MSSLDRMKVNLIGLGSFRVGGRRIIFSIKDYEKRYQEMIAALGKRPQTHRRDMIIKETRKKLKQVQGLLVLYGLEKEKKEYKRQMQLEYEAGQEAIFNRILKEPEENESLELNKTMEKQVENS